jgi:hypothetical protein
LRTPQEDCAQNPHEISAFAPKLELRDEIVRITLSPLFLLLPPASHLTIRIPTSSLTQANSWIRPEPTPANAAGFLSGM